MLRLYFRPLFSNDISSQENSMSVSITRVKQNLCIWLLDLVMY
jgi:hypothetical protein